MADESLQTGTDSEVPDEYSMTEGHRPEQIRRRNRITGLVLVLLIAVIVGITIWSRATGEAEKYNPVGEPADELGEQRAPSPPDRSGSER